MRIAIWWQQESWGGVDTHLAAFLDAWPAPEDEFLIFHNSRNPGLRRIAPAICRARAKLVQFPEWHQGNDSAVRRAIWHFLLPLRMAVWVARARALLVANGPLDVFIANNGSYPGAWTCLAALCAATRLRIGKRVLLVHHAAVTYGIGRQLVEQLIDRGVQNWATDIVAVSRATRESLVRLRFFNTECNPIRVIHNGISSTVKPDRDPAVRVRWGGGSDDFIIGMIGRVERYKGHEDVLLALADLPVPMRRRARLVVVGSGSEDECLRLRRMSERLGLGEHVHFAGYMADEAVFLIRQFDLLIMATKDFEGFGLAVAEAMVAGTPVLATSVGGVPEFVTPEVGVLVPPESPAALALAIESIIDDPDATAARAQRARSHIAAYSDTTMARRFHQLLSV